jgi:two-component system, chemotaxis family, protein-glutamate methylesterase/glutaminase
MPAKHDVIVIGTSAGGVDALQQLVSTLPADIPAAIFVVMHMAAWSKSLLPEILTKAGRLTAQHPVDGAETEYGRIYVAPADHHLVVERGHVHLTAGPKEQHHRPAINVTFRSAANAYGERVIGVLLSGEMDDGTAGLWEIERRGGLTVVQNPEEAAFPSMPLSALREVEVDHTVPLAEMGALLSRLARNANPGRVVVEHAGSSEVEPNPKLTDVTCPECRGTIWEVRRGKAKDFRCRVGHTYSARSMLAGHFAAREKALYAAMVALEESASLADRLADQFDPAFAERLRSEAQQSQVHAARIRQLLEERLRFDMD